MHFSTFSFTFLVLAYVISGKSLPFDAESVADSPAYVKRGKFYNFPFINTQH